MSEELQKIAWKGQLYERFQVTVDDAYRLKKRYIDCEGAVLTGNHLRYEFLLMDRWLDENKVKAARRGQRGWHRWICNWLNSAEEDYRNKPHGKRATEFRSWLQQAQRSLAGEQGGYPTPGCQRESSARPL